MFIPDPNTPLLIVTQKTDEWGTSDYYAPLLCCGHYGTPTFDCSSQWEFPADAQTCPVCGEVRQMVPRLQYLITAEAWGEIPAVYEGDEAR